MKFRKYKEAKSHMGVDAFVKVAQMYSWCELDVRRKLNAAGLHVLPANFYSAVPTVEEVESSFEYTEDEPPYLLDSVFGAERMRGFLAEIQQYAAEFDPPEEGDSEDPSGFFWMNATFSYSDAMASYCILRYLKPRRVLEIGSGFSTLVALQALERNGSGEILCVEPYPQPYLKKRTDLAELIEEPVQSLSPTFFREALRDGDVLFIDSTHTVKLGSDCLHLYLRVLPQLTADLMIHVHDVFLPEASPKSWALEHHIYWTEQYLLLALLIGNPDFDVCFGSNYHKVVNPGLLAKFMGGKADSGGGSFWFRKRKVGGGPTASR